MPFQVILSLFTFLLFVVYCVLTLSMLAVPLASRSFNKEKRSGRDIFFKRENTNEPQLDYSLKHLKGVSERLFRESVKN